MRKAEHFNVFAVTDRECICWKGIIVKTQSMLPLIHHRLDSQKAA